MKKNLLIILIVFLFMGCFSQNKNIKYIHTVFIIDKSVSLNKDDFKKIDYKKINDNTYAGYYILSKEGNSKLYNLFKNKKGKHFGIVINNRVLNFNTKIVENIFDKVYDPNNAVTFQFKKEEMEIFLKSIGLNLEK